MTIPGQVYVRFLAVLPLAVLILASSPAAGESWEATRKNVIDPLNSALHSHWPTELENRNLDVLLSFYAVDTGTGIVWGGTPQVSGAGTERTLRWTAPRGEESIRERYRRLLELFGEIHNVEQRIGRVDWRNPSPLGHRTTVHTIVRGVGPDGDLRQLEQRATLTMRFFDPFWEITSEEVTERTLVSREQPRFEWATDSAGIRSVHANEASPPFRLFGGHDENPVREASGVAVGDADGDGCEDLVLAGSPELVF